MDDQNTIKDPLEDVSPVECSSPEEIAKANKKIQDTVIDSLKELGIDVIEFKDGQKFTPGEKNEYVNALSEGRYDDVVRMKSHTIRQLRDEAMVSAGIIDNGQTIHVIQVSFTVPRYTVKFDEFSYKRVLLTDKSKGTVRPISLSKYAAFNKATANPGSYKVLRGAIGIDVEGNFVYREIDPEGKTANVVLIETL